MIKAILLDWNGVVIDDEQLKCDAYREVLNPYGIDLTDDMYYARMGMNDTAFVTSVFEELGKPVDENELGSILGSKTAKWRETVAKNVPIFDGVESFLKKSSNEFALGVVSMARREEIDLVLNLTGLSPNFKVILSAEDIATHKPDPACYREGFRRIDLSRIAEGHLPMTHSDCLVIEDTPQGVQAGRAADLLVLGVANTVSADDLRSAGAYSVADRLDDWMPESISRVFN
jgi:phosphoglycolate phosphatase/beta-phosphoglucomutase